MKTQVQVTFAISPTTSGFSMSTMESMKSEMVHLYGKGTKFVESGDRVNVLADGCHVAYLKNC